MLDAISPFFIVGDLARSVRFYEERLGFEVRHSTPKGEPFFAIVERDGVRVFLKEIAPDVEPMPNASRHEWAPWDAFVSVDDPETVAAKYGAMIEERDDGLCGFEVRDPDGYVLFFGRPGE